MVFLEKQNTQNHQFLGTTINITVLGYPLLLILDSQVFSCTANEVLVVGVIPSTRFQILSNLHLVEVYKVYIS